MHLHVKPKGNEGLVTHITPATAGWQYCGLDVYHLRSGESATAQTDDREHCLVWLHGSGEAMVNDCQLGQLGGRSTPFDGSPAAVYVPPDNCWKVTATSDLALAVCSAPGDASGNYQHRVIDAMRQETRGKGSNTRYITDILPQQQPAHSLLVVEVITPAGHSSSYPPHKHDSDDLPHETRLEEIYYHRINPSQGFGFQRVYDDTRTIDQAIAVENGDSVLVPYGYHPCVACHGYDLYYLNVMAGPTRKWKFRNDPQHEWMLEG